MASWWSTNTKVQTLKQATASKIAQKLVNENLERGCEQGYMMHVAACLFICRLAASHTSYAAVTQPVVKQPTAVVTQLVMQQ